MKQFNIFAISLVFIATGGTTFAQEQIQEKKLGITLDLTYVSRYIWRGFDTYPKNHSAFQPSIDLDLYGTGFGVNIWASMANKSGFEDSKEIDYTIYYDNSFFSDETWQTDYRFSWVYYSYPGQSRDAANQQEISGSFSWPKICPFGVVPSYTVVRTWPAESEADNRDTGGWLHIFGLCYDINLPPILPNTTEQVICLSFETIYNDGTYGEDVAHDWSHAVFGISSPFCLSENLTFTPGFYYQSSWEDSVNEHDEHWVSFSLKYKF